jgi:hypothetical protein
MRQQRKEENGPGGKTADGSEHDELLPAHIGRH